MGKSDFQISKLIPPELDDSGRGDEGTEYEEVMERSIRAAQQGGGHTGV
jgi:hypothetical protein